MINEQKPYRITILLENHCYPLDVRVQPHAEALVEAGYKVTVISPNEKGRVWKEFINGVLVFRYPTIYAKRSKFGFILEFLIATFFLLIFMFWVWARYGMDILLFYNPPDILGLIGAIPKLMKKSIILDLRDHAPELYLSKFQGGNQIIHKILLWMEYCSCRIADQVVVTNESSRKIVHKRNGVSLARITVVRQGPDIKKIYPKTPDPQLRARARIIIGYLGSLAPERGVGDLLRALSIMDHDFGFHDWLCLLIGRPLASLDLEQAAAKLGINERICFTGFLPLEEWVTTLSAADICVDPGSSNSVNDISTTNKMMDYMALGKPMVVFDLPERRVTAGESALYAKSNDASELARLLVDLIENPELRSKLGAVGRARVETELAWEHQKKRLLSLFACIAPIGHRVEKAAS